MRVLIVYGSKSGATAEVADTVAATLAERGIVADVCAAESCPSPDGYDGVLVGSGLYEGRWLSAPTWFVRSHAARLRTIPVWFFSCGPLERRAEAPGLAPVDDVARLGRLISVKGHVTFGDDAAPPARGVVARLRPRPRPSERHLRPGVAAWADRIADLLISRGHHPSVTRSHAPNMER
jgi:menaquinone-dependent protoporphyrinogen oxidase